MEEKKINLVLSSPYKRAVDTIRHFAEKHQFSIRTIDVIYQLSIGNPMFYKYCPPYVTKESILSDMITLSPNKTEEDQFYIGYFKENK